MNNRGQLVDNLWITRRLSGDLVMIEDLAAKKYIITYFEGVCFFLFFSCKHNAIKFVVFFGVK